MQINLQALFAETGGAGKKPDGILPAVEGGEIMFADLLLPDTPSSDTALATLPIGIDPVNLPDAPPLILPEASSAAGTASSGSETAAPNDQSVAISQATVLPSGPAKEAPTRPAKADASGVPEIAFDVVAKRQDAGSVGQGASPALPDSSNTGIPRMVPAATAGPTCDVGSRPAPGTERQAEGATAASRQVGSAVPDSPPIDKATGARRADPVPPRAEPAQPRAEPVPPRAEPVLPRAEPVPPRADPVPAVTQSANSPEETPPAGAFLLREPPETARPTEPFGEKAETSLPQPEAVRPAPARAGQEVAATAVPVTSAAGEPKPRDGAQRSRRDDRTDTRLPASGSAAPDAKPAAAAPAIMAAPAAQSAVPRDAPLPREAMSPSIDATTGLTPSEGEELHRQAPATTRTEPAGRPVINQVVHMVLRAAPEGVVEVRLSPEELGRVRLSMSQAEGGMTVHISAERPETLDLMRRNVDMLESDLRDQGFQDLNFSFGEGEPGDPRQDFSTDNDDTSLAPGIRADIAPRPAPAHDGRLDIRL